MHQGYGGMVSLLRRDLDRSELRARLIVSYGLHPDAASEISSDPAGAAARMETLVEDLEDTLRNS